MSEFFIWDDGSVNIHSVQTYSPISPHSLHKSAVVSSHIIVIDKVVVTDMIIVADNRGHSASRAYLSHYLVTLQQSLL